MSDAILAAPGRFQRLGVPERLCRIVRRIFSVRRVVAADELDAWLRQDIGAGSAPPPDRLTAHYHRLMRRGQPLS